MNSTSNGTLFIVATPIGNLQDITLRALETLKNVDLILAEDTRHTSLLLNHYTIQKPILSFHEHNEQARAVEVVAKLQAGQSIALVSDAGTPLISDPGYKLVRLCIQSGIPIDGLPGPTAAIMALMLSGLPPDKFLFLGFLPQKPGKRQKVLENIRPFLHNSSANGLQTTVIIYESPHHLGRTLSDMQLIFGDITIVVCRELTKIHQEIFRGSVSEVINHFVHPKGEFVVLF